MLKKQPDAGGPLHRAVVLIIENCEIPIDTFELRVML